MTGEVFEISVEKMNELNEKPVLAEVLTAQKIIQNCLDCWDDKRFSTKHT